MIVFPLSSLQNQAKCPKMLICVLTPNPRVGATFLLMLTSHLQQLALTATGSHAGNWPCRQYLDECMGEGAMGVSMG